MPCERTVSPPPRHVWPRAGSRSSGRGCPQLIQVGPAALHPYIGLVHPPGAVTQSEMRPDPLLQFGGVSLNPAESRRVIYRDAAIRQHQLKVAVADREHQIPPHRPQDHLTRELPSLERLILSHRRPTPSDPASIMPRSGRPKNFAAEPPRASPGGNKPIWSLRPAMSLIVSELGYASRCR